jgi:hypothetical protein
LRDFRRQGFDRGVHARALQIHALQLYEIFDMGLHPFQQVYGIDRPLQNESGTRVRRRSPPHAHHTVRKRITLSRAESAQAKAGNCATKGSWEGN